MASEETMNEIWDEEFDPYREQENREAAMTDTPKCGAIAENGDYCVKPRGHNLYHATTMEPAETSKDGHFWHDRTPKSDTPKPIAEDFDEWWRKMYENYRDTIHFSADQIARAAWNARSALAETRLAFVQTQFEASDEVLIQVSISLGQAQRDKEELIRGFEALWAVNYDSDRPDTKEEHARLMAIVNTARFLIQKHRSQS